MSGIENNGIEFLKLGKKGKQIDLNALKGGIKKNDINKSIFEKFDTNKDGKLDTAETDTLVEFLKKYAGNDGVLSKREVKNSKIFGRMRNNVNNFYSALNDIYNQQTVLNTKQQPVPDSKEQPVIEPFVEQNTTVQSAQVQEEVLTDIVEEETPQTDIQEEQAPVEQQNLTHKYKVNYKDTWYGIVQAKYDLKDNKQIKEVIKQLKAQNNVNPKATNMPEEITLPDTVTLKDGTEIKLADIDAAVDQSHWGFKTQSKTGRYTITQNGKTKYYAADGTELKQSYFEAKEASPDKLKKSENGSGRYSYTASNGETWYFAADGTPLKEKYYNKRESEYTAVNAQKDTVKNARAAFEKQQDEDGWAGKTADAVSALWNSDNRAVKVEADLKKYENQIKDLQKAQSQGSTQFNAKFKEIFGVDYNPENVAAYEANPTEENYKKAYGTKNDIHKRVMDYNKSQQEGAAAVKTTTVIAASTAAALATGGTSLLGTAAIIGATTAAARATAEVTDLATNNIEGDITGEKLDDIAEQAMIEGTVAGVTAGTLKGLGSLRTAKVQPKGSGSTARIGTGNNTSGSGSTARTGTGNNTSGSGSTARIGTGNNTSGSGSTARIGTGNNTSGTGNAGASTGAAGEKLKAAQDIMSKLSGKQEGLNSLTHAEKTKLAEMLEITPDKLSNLTKADYKKLILKFHPDRYKGDPQFAQVMASIINKLRV